MFSGYIYLIMQRLFYLLLLFVSVAVCAQSQAVNDRPQRTPDELAKKQTEMLVRRLHLTDSVQRDTLYRLHLKYAKLRMISNTVREDLERRIAINDELKGILSPEQYEQFMNLQIQQGPRRPQQAVGRVVPNGAEQQIPQQQSEPRQ